MNLKFVLFQILLTACLLNKLISTEPISADENTDLVNQRLTHFIKRFEIIINNIKDETYLSELKTLKAIFETTLANDSDPEKIHLLEDFLNTMPDNFKTFLLDELDKEYINEKIKVDLSYIVVMDRALKRLGHSKEVAELAFQLAAVYRVDDLNEKYLKYSLLIDNLSPEFQEILDSQPPHEILLNAHLQFLLHYLIFLALHGDVVEFEEELNELNEQLFSTLRTGDYNGKLRFLNKFNDVSTKFGRMLNARLIDYKIDYNLKKKVNG